MALTVKNLTKGVIVTIVIVSGGYDIYALIAGGTEATISYITLSYARSYPIIPFAVGVLCGHLFWSQKEATDGRY